MSPGGTTRRLKVGLMLPQTEGMRGPGVRGWRQVADMARLGEEVGFDSLWLVDHLVYQLEGEDQLRGVWEGWSMLSAVAAMYRWTHATGSPSIVSERTSIHWVGAMNDITPVPLRGTS